MASLDEEKGYESESDGEMPKDGKKGKNRHSVIQSDLTLKDFADSSMPQSCSRVKKSVASVSSPLAISKTTTSAQNIVENDKEEVDWFDKDLDDFVIEDRQDDEEDEEDSAPVISKPSKKKKCTTTDGDKSGFVWPVDLWYMLSSYIHPDDISRFSRLCKSAHTVTQLSSFWRKLYFRYYHVGPDGPPRLPDHLRPSSVERLHGLRARVIRTLFQLYPPLMDRVACKGPMDQEPHDLKGHRCLLSWHQPAPKGWQFCFKFQKPSLQALSSRPVCKEDVYEGYNDLFYNPDEGCSVLQVTCCHFSSVSANAVMGLLLNQVHLSLSANLRHHRLRLHFDSHLVASHNPVTSEMQVVLDGVMAVKVMDWWHPTYPFTS